MSWWVWILVGVGCYGWFYVTLWVCRVGAWRRRWIDEVDDEDEGIELERSPFAPPILRRKPPDTGYKGGSLI
jgi:hypothetical protein